MKCPGHYFTAVAATQQMFPRELLKALWVKTCLVPLAPRSRMLLADIPALIPVGWRRAITNTPPCEHHVELNAGAPAGVSFRVPAGLLEGNQQLKELCPKFDKPQSFHREHHFYFPG